METLVSIDHYERSNCDNIDGNFRIAAPRGMDQTAVVQIRKHAGIEIVDPDNPVHVRGNSGSVLYPGDDEFLDTDWVPV